jgi:hypothetical protein
MPKEGFSQSFLTTLSQGFLTEQTATALPQNYLSPHGCLIEKPQ